MKRYLVFMFKPYYPSGGAEDFKGSIDNIDELRELINNIIHSKDDFYSDDIVELNLLDTKTMAIITETDISAFNISDDGIIDENQFNLIKSIIEENNK